MKKTLPFKNPASLALKKSPAAIALTLLLSACVSPSPKVDATFGDSLERSKQAQKIEPTPAQRRAPTPATTSAEVQRAVTTQSSGTSGPLSGAQSGTSGSTGFGSGATSSSTSPSGTRW